MKSFPFLYRFINKNNLCYFNSFLTSIFSHQAIYNFSLSNKNSDKSHIFLTKFANLLKDNALINTNYLFNFLTTDIIYNNYQINDLNDSQFFGEILLNDLATQPEFKIIVTNTYTKEYTFDCTHNRKMQCNSNLLTLFLRENINLQEWLNTLNVAKRPAHFIAQMCLVCLDEKYVIKQRFLNMKTGSCVMIEIERQYFDGVIKRTSARLEVQFRIKIQGSVFKFASAIIYRNMHYLNVIYRNKIFYLVDNSKIQIIERKHVVELIERYSRMVSYSKA